LRLNIYSYDTNNKEIKQITHHSKYDVMWPSGENGALAYEMGGYIYKLDLKSGNSKKITVNINFDNPNILPYYKNVKDDIHSYAVSPLGNRALFDARGDIFSVPAENGPTINLTRTQGVREIFPAWSPDGKYISYISDKTGEYEIFLLENKDYAKPKQITDNSSAWKYETVWSPDSKFMVFSDRTLKLRLLNVETQELLEIDKANQNEIHDYRFSPDSKWITYTKNANNGQSAIWVYNIAKKENNKLTDNTFSDMLPVFSSCGNYIFFISNRDYNLAFSDFEFNYVYNKASRIFALALKKDSPKLFEYKNDVVQVKEDKKNKKDKEIEKKSVSISIDFDGINSRIMAFPVSAGNYYNLEAVKNGILFIDKKGVHKYDITKEKDQIVLKDVREVVPTADSKKLFYRYKDNFGIAKIAPKQDAASGKLDLSDLDMKIYPRKEWKQVYTDGWRIFRDYFYVKNMHNVDWKTVKDNYAQLLPYVSHRADLDYIFGEIISEINIGHAYDNFGDFEEVKRIETGLLGAKLTADKNANRYIIENIYNGENWNASRLSPLTAQGVNVNEGDYIISINGNDVTLADNPYKFLENTVGKIVEITVNGKPKAEGARKYKIKPIKSEQSLFYLNWVESRRKMVDKLSGGKIGYIHVPNTSYEGNRELFKGMYAYHDKKALIIDDRYNGGGFIPDVMTDLLNRKTLSYWLRKYMKHIKKL
jgi:tricorn protease